MNLAAIALAVLIFSPVILQPGRVEPFLFSMPFTLWTSMVVTVILVLLTFIASKLKDED